MPLDWMNAGPGELDLASPLLAGMKQGTAMAEQQEKVRSDYANEAQMKAALGLEAKKESFSENMWNSQADMRVAQLDLTKDQAQESAQRLSNVVSDKAAVDAWSHDVNAKIGAGDVEGALNTPMPTVMTPDAFSSMVNTRTSLAATGAGAAVEQKKQSILAANALVTKNHADLISEATGAGIPLDGYAVKDPATGKQAIGPDGLPVYNYADMAKATVQAGVAVKGQEAQQSAAYLAAQMRAQASMYGANTRAETSKETNANTVAGRTLNRLYQARDDAMKNGDDTSFWDAQIQAQGGSAGASTAAPSTTATDREALAVKAIQGTITPGAVTPANPTSPAPPQNVNAGGIINALFTIPASIAPPPVPAKLTSIWDKKTTAPADPWAGAQRP